MAAVLARLAVAQGELVEMARRLGVAEGECEMVRTELAVAQTEAARSAALDVSLAALRATLEAIRDERDRLLTREHLRDQRSWWRRLAG